MRNQRPWEYSLSFSPQEAMLLEQETNRRGLGSVSALVKEYCALPHSIRDRRKMIRGPRALNTRAHRKLNNGRVRYTVVIVDLQQQQVLEDMARSHSLSPGQYLKHVSIAQLPNETNTN